ncbi:phenylalanine--tRNA ligase subunit beta [Methanobacterium congolense]|uniref:Phenylalanine--tRNA ligase beta subunit n=1 Tax=Methanobacterium congolense TaxID=118062 RepID=A0A1D3L2M9_9EURY|nr:phenylalanine--tRNA ligase subunit beta [Methanobacterium congolense]SCG85803.1 Phenylalanine-tRNA ligase beta subunit [Methanobacterium congolense]
MPVINFSYKDIDEALGQKIPKNELIDMLPMIGSDIEDYDDENLKVEFFPNRPDHYSVEGITRTLKGMLGIEEGMPIYETSPSGTTMTVDPELKVIRPYTSCCIVEGVNIDDEKLVQLMDFQEDLHWVIGRDRKKVAIGIHNLDVLKPPFSYMAADPDSESFLALEMTEPQSLRQILENHKKGRKYAHLIEKFDKYPLIKDSEGNILSMPPIINGDLTKLSTETRNVFIDVTGTDERAVNHALNIIATSFAEAGGKIKTVKVIYGDREVETPDLTPKEFYVSVKNAQKRIGEKLTAPEVVRMLKRVRLHAEAESDDKIRVLVPAYRIDVLHEVDLIENIAIGYGFRDIGSELPDIATIAYEDKTRFFENRIREVMTGMGFNEVMSLMLTNEEHHYYDMRLPEDDRVMVAQPISQDRTMIRKSLLNGLMEFLEDNKHEELPQKIFEVGDVVYMDGETETHTKIVKKLAGAVVHSTANFTEIKSITDAMIQNLGLKMEIEPLEHPSFIGGRCAGIKGIKETSNDSESGKQEVQIMGFFGELHPEVITNFEMEYPVVAFEVEFKGI